jgi:hypothetical protein
MVANNNQMLPFFGPKCCPSSSNNVFDIHSTQTVAYATPFLKLCVWVICWFVLSILVSIFDKVAIFVVL